jgi:hypothetical protein
MASARSAPPRTSVLRELSVALAVLVAGLVLGEIWALWAPSLADSADLGESKVTVDGLLALLGIGAGVLTAVGLAIVPGPRPPIRLAVVLLAATAGNLLAVLAGVTHTLSLGAPGVALLWPLTTAVLTALRTLASFVFSPDDDGAGERESREGISEPPRR